jgi:protein-tyrosine phosphatase
MAATDGTARIIATPHQLGSYAHVSADIIRQRVGQLQELLRQHHLPLQVLPGADVRIEPELLWQIRRGNVMTLADRQRHVLLELPHELCFQLDTLADELHAARLAGILSHPERNQQLAADPRQIERLVDKGYLMQITAGSLHGTFGERSRQTAEWMLGRGLVHLVASDAHGVQARRPLLARAHARVAQLTDPATADDLLQHHPHAVCDGRSIPAGRRQTGRSGWQRWMQWRKAG